MNFNSNHNSNLDQNIEGYLRGELSPMEARGFEQQIAENADLSEAVQFQKDIIDTLKAERKAQLKARLQNIELPKCVAQGTFSTPFYANKNVIAAGIVAITSVSAALLFFFNTDKKEISSEISHNTPKNPSEILTETSKESSDKNSIKNIKENQPSIVNNDNIFREDKTADNTSEKSSNKNSINPIVEKKDNTANISTENKAENTTIAETPKEETKIPVTTKETKKINFEYQHFYQYDKNNETLVFVTDIGKHKFLKDIDLGNGAKDYLLWNDLFFEIKSTQDINNLKDGLITNENQILQLQTIFKRK